MTRHPNALEAEHAVCGRVMQDKQPLKGAAHENELRSSMSVSQRLQML